MKNYQVLAASITGVNGKHLAGGKVYAAHDFNEKHVDNLVKENFIKEVTDEEHKAILKAEDEALAAKKDYLKPKLNIEAMEGETTAPIGEGVQLNNDGTAPVVFAPTVPFKVTKKYLDEHPELVDVKVGDTIQVPAPQQ